MNKFEISAALQEIASLMKLKGKDQYRWRAYARAAQAVAEVGPEFPTLVESNRLTEIKGVGDSLARVIGDLYNTGQSSLLDKLRAELPEGVLALSKVPGLTLKKIQALNQSLGITNLSELNAALEAGKLRDVPGFGAKSESELREKVATYQTGDQSLLLLHALRSGEKLIEYMQGFPDLISIDIAGSARRWTETVSTIRITGAAKFPEDAIKYFLSFPAITSVEDQRPDSATVRLIEGIKVSFSAATPEEYFNLLHYETGSQPHLSRVTEIAKQKHLQLTPRQLRSDGSRKELKIKSEADIYRHLGMQYVPPELREDEGEIEAALANEIPADLIRLEDIRGQVHCHTTYSDGRNTVEQMALAAQAMGMKYMTITDHSPTASYAGGLQVDRLKKQWEEIDRVQENVSIKLLRGTESDILRDGGLDYPDAILEKFDVIIASIHQRYKLDEGDMTRRIINAIKNPLFKVWGHPLGRLVQRRPPIAVRLEEILDVIAESKAAIEISGDPHRLDLEPRWIKEARKRPIKFVISTDAHSISDLHNLKFGIGMARRAGVTKREVLNTQTLNAFRKAVAPTG